MKEIIAIIRINMINKTKEALLNQGIYALHCSKVVGRGKKKVDLSFIEDIKNLEEINYGKFAGEIIENYRLSPRRMITVIVNDAEKDKAIKTIIDTNITGNPGDGKIFVCNIPEAVRIRTGEKNEEAL
ncbi:P-II family nitrogen regulator [Clostridium sp. 19966]|uniref:P-II family nitrogen regulator n=1 Tax=Clostridium sp. 19966 TaxID=2768166 RepID=UPI0028DDC742|nr:P-II family nitrogen regulator [Clostridium sp. 19966]MDT8717423.1 P-II family nitrogen regulator [Clostridium sp. 19966]